MTKIINGPILKLEVDMLKITKYVDSDIIIKLFNHCAEEIKQRVPKDIGICIKISHENVCKRL